MSEKEPAVTPWRRVSLMVAAYLGVSLLLSSKVEEASTMVIDEEFHLPQGLAYCRGDWAHWEPKLTTPPGLYLLSALLSPALGCSVRALRVSSLLLSAVGLALLARRGIARLALLPPLCLLAQLYYTDAAALAVLLLTLELVRARCPLSAAAAAVFSVLVRQTNVVWLAFCLARLMLNAAVATHTRDSSRRHYSAGEGCSAVIFHLKTFFVYFFRRTPPADLKVMLSLLSAMAGFVVFVAVNGSIVLGDKAAHEASIHIPQLFYFLLFYAAFSLPLLLSTVREDVRECVRWKGAVVLQLCACALVVRYNTLVHPYLLADNRHYTFYAWSRWWGRYWWARYASVPLYVYVGRSAWRATQRAGGAGLVVPFILALVGALVPQKLLEPRYFVPPLVLLRQELPSPAARAESLLYLLINAITFYIFFTKEIKWANYDHVQRLIW